MKTPGGGGGGGQLPLEMNHIQAVPHPREVDFQKSTLNEDSRVDQLSHPIIRTDL